MAGRQTRGRQRIPIRRIENQDDMYATFSKRRLGLYKKASELSTLCGVDIGVIIFSPTNNPFSFFHPSMESVVERYRTPNQPMTACARAIDDHTRARVEQLNQRLDEVLEAKEQAKENEKHLDQADGNRPKGWWEAPVESLDQNQAMEWIAWFKNVRARVDSQIERINNGASGSAAPPQQQQQNVPDFPDVGALAAGPGMFPLSHDLLGSSSFDPTGGMLGETDLFSSQYFNFPSEGEGQYQSGGNETGQLPGESFQLPGPSSSTQVQDQSGQISGNVYHLPGLPTTTQVQDFPGTVREIGSSYAFPGSTSQAQQDPLFGSQSMGYSLSPYYFHPGSFQGQNSPGGGSGNAELFGGFFGTFPQQDQNPEYGSGIGGGGDGKNDGNKGSQI